MLKLNQTEIRAVTGAEKVSADAYCLLTTTPGTPDHAYCCLYPKDLFIDLETKIYYDSYGNFVSNTIIKEKLIYCSPLRQ